jgi:hypothetical protein
VWKKWNLFHLLIWDCRVCCGVRLFDWPKCRYGSIFPWILRSAVLHHVANYSGSCPWIPADTLFYTSVSQMYIKAQMASYRSWILSLNWFRHFDDVWLTGSMSRLAYLLVCVCPLHFQIYVWIPLPRRTLLRSFSNRICGSPSFLPSFLPSGIELALVLVWRFRFVFVSYESSEPEGDRKLRHRSIYTHLRALNKKSNTNGKNCNISTYSLDHVLTYMER